MNTVSRVIRSKDEARTSYNKLSRWYDLVSGSSEKKYRDVGLQKLAARPGERALEIGFGTGHCILALAEAVGAEGKVCGIDLSEGMLGIAQARIDGAGLQDRVDLRAGDALHLPFGPGSFDGVFMSFTLELFDTPEIPQVLEQCRTALKPGGRLAVVSLVKKPGTAVRIYEWFHERMPAAVDCRPIHAQADLEAAGFELREATPMSMWGLPVEIILSLKRTD
jgi:ubiquinone/menaquinone biosynthesis C-methylase UbiE